jgi:hypothetical protein
MNRGRGCDGYRPKRPLRATRGHCHIIFEGKDSRPRDRVPVRFWPKADIPIACKMSPSLIGRLGSSVFKLSTTAAGMSLTGSCFSSESALSLCVLKTSSVLIW